MISASQLRPIFALLAIFIVAAGTAACDGSKLPSRSTLFKLAVASAGEEGLLPPDATILPVEGSIFSIGKNAARVDLAYMPSGESSGVIRHSICLKRVAMTWRFERAYPTPTYATPAQTAPAPEVR